MEGRTGTEECSFERTESELNLSGLFPLFVGIQKIVLFMSKYTTRSYEICAV